MGISNYRFIKDDNINEVKESLEKFMDVKIAGKTLPERWTKITTIDSSMTTLPAAAAVIPEPEPIHITLEKKTSAAAKIPQTATHEVLPPDESDASILTGKKKVNPAVKRLNNKDNEDILKDASIINGFHSGKDKEIKKKGH